MGRKKVLLVRALGVEDEAALLKRIKQVCAHRTNYHRQSTQKKKELDAKAKATVSAGKHAHGHGHGHESGGHDDHAPAHGDERGEKTGKENWGTLKSWVKQPILNIAHSKSSQATSRWQACDIS